MTTVTVVFQPPGSKGPGGVIAQPLSPDGLPSGEPTADGFKVVGGMVVWSGGVLKEVTAVRFSSTAGWEHVHLLPYGATRPREAPTAVLSHDFGGSDALLYRDRMGRPVGGAAVSVYPAGATPADKPDGPPVAQTVTTRDGRWTTRVAVPPEQFIIVFEKPGLFGPDRVRVTIPAREA